MKRLWLSCAISFSLATGCSPESTQAGGTTEFEADTGTDGTSWGDTSAFGSSDETSAEQPNPGSSGNDEAGSTGASQPPPDPYFKAYYPAAQVHSPITRFVADRLREIAQAGPSHREDVFIKAGASSTVSRNTLYCFAGPDVDLGEHGELEPTLQFFLGGEAAGTTPFDRDTFAAQSGRSAGWAIDGDPSPLELELSTLSPRLGLVHYGANDMGLGATYASALRSFYVNMMDLSDVMVEQGVVPILLGITRRGDSQSANLWVATYNAVIRGIAQSHQVPFVDLYHAIDPLPGHGLSEDGLHLEAYAEGACQLDDDGLTHGYNVRNLIALQALDRAVAILVDDFDALDEAVPAPSGTGDLDAPIEVGALPWTDARNTALDGDAKIDRYTGCASETDERGPEVAYALELTSDTRLRALVLDRPGVDVDLHLLDETGQADGCITRDDTLIEGTLAPGSYRFVVDSWSDGEQVFAGDYLFALVECDDDDPACDATL